MKHPIMRLLAVVLLSTASTLVSAQDGSRLRPAQAAAPTNARLNGTDREFLEELGRMRIGETRSSELALERSRSEGVKGVARSIIKHHEKTGPELDALAAANGVKLPSKVDQTREDYLNTLRATKDGDFDRVFLEGQKADHQRTVDLFHKQDKSGQNSGLKDFVAARMRDVEAMRAEVDAMARRMGVKS